MEHFDWDTGDIKKLNTTIRMPKQSGMAWHFLKTPNGMILLSHTQLTTKISSLLTLPQDVQIRSVQVRNAQQNPRNGHQSNNSGRT